MVNYNNYYSELDWLKSQKYYHGTSSNVEIKDGILLPSMFSKNIREQSLNQVYVTSSYSSAKKYAYKAAKKFGGDPIVYEVEPDFDSLVNRVDFEFICDFATIIKEA